MAESKKNPGHAPSRGNKVGADSQEAESFSEQILSREELDNLSTMQVVDMIIGKLPHKHSAILDMVYLRERIGALEETNEEARAAIEKLDAAVEKLRSPALRVGTYLMPIEPDQALVCIGGTDYVCNVDPQIPLSSLQVGQRVLCNEAFAVAKGLGYDKNGPIARIDEQLSDGRLRVGHDSGLSPVVVQRSALLAKDKLKPGLEVRLDANQRVALEVVGTGKRVERSLDLVTELPWSAIGGQETAVRDIRNTIELPVLYRDLFQRFEHSIPKGFLLHGPPGCGKTMLGKATAYNLRQQIKEHTNVDRPEFFLHVKGPELLNMWVGESERQVRDLFAQCRERAAEGALAFLFIDEAESLLGTRHAGRISSMVSTMVPMFCTEMDGLEPLQNVVVILASNRADLIDPAILRPGRIDRKIKVERPDEDAARQIYQIYLPDSLPLAEPKEDLAEAAAAAHYARTPENQFLEVSYRSGKTEILTRGDLASGAVIAAVVERAKSLAIKRAIEQKEDESQLSRDDLIAALELEYLENDLFPSAENTEDWLKLTDLDPDNVVRLAPYKPRKTERPGHGVI